MRRGWCYDAMFAAFPARGRRQHMSKSFSQVREVLKRAGSDREALRRLISEPARFVKEAGLSEETSKLLRGADLVIAAALNPLSVVQDGFTQTIPITITVTKGGDFVSGDPPFLNSLSEVELIAVLHAVLNSPAYQARLQQALGEDK
jgi:hypothetical protein